MLKQSLNLKIGQQLTMTPALQQAIKLLQLSALDLQQEIQEALDSNVMLETEENAQETEAQEKDAAAEKPEAADAEPAKETEASSQDEIPDDLALDCGWDDYYSGDGSTALSRAAPDEDSQPLAERVGEDDHANLAAHLHWQLGLMRLSETDLLIAETLIDDLDEDGYLSTSLDELLDTLSDELAELAEDDDEPAGPDEMQTVLHRLQAMDPAGVCARDLRECLLLQLRELDPETPALDLARTLVDGHLDTLAGADLGKLARSLGVTEDSIHQAIATIRSLNPRPGGAYSNRRIEYIAPDVYVRRSAGGWQVRMNPDTAPRLRVNSMYAGLVGQTASKRDGEMLRNHLQEAKWFIKSLQSRNETIMKVATSIVARQEAFFDAGEEALKPMVLRDVAEEIEMHESTISRVTSSKYMHTPRGILPFKFFFSSHVGTSDGGEASATAIQAMIRKMIADEPPANTLSDSRLVKDLEGRGIKIARRTVAKYREAMNLPPSHARKRLA